MNFMPQFFQENQWLIIILAIWNLIWKGLALYKAARREEKLWFILLLVANTLGILEMLYLFLFSKKKKANV